MYWDGKGHHVMDAPPPGVPWSAPHLDHNDILTPSIVGTRQVAGVDNMMLIGGTHRYGEELGQLGDMVGGVGAVEVGQRGDVGGGSRRVKVGQLGDGGRGSRPAGRRKVFVSGTGGQQGGVCAGATWLEWIT